MIKKSLLKQISQNVEYKMNDHIRQFIASPAGPSLVFSCDILSILTEWRGIGRTGKAWGIIRRLRND